MMKLKYLVAGIFLSLSTHLALAQYNSSDDPLSETTPKPFGTADGGGFDSINLDNGFLRLNIPVFSFPQRGGKLSLGVHLEYQPISIYQIGGSGAYAGTTLSYGGIRILPNYDDVIDAENVAPQGYDYVLNMNSGAHHMGALSDGGHSIAIDGSGYQWNVPSNANVLDSPFRAGISVTNANGVRTDQSTLSNMRTLTDSNGNFITIDYANHVWTDTLGRTIPFPTVSTWSTTYDAGSGKSTGVWSVPGIMGSTAPYTFKWQVTGWINAYCTAANSPSCQQYNTGGQGWEPEILGIPTDQSLLQGSRLSDLANPDGTAWSFTYDLAYGQDSTAHYGDLTSITTPLGATVTYTWGNFPQWLVDEGVGVGGWVPLHRTVTARSVDLHDGNGSQTWHYDLKQVNVGAGSVTVSNLQSTGAENPLAYAPYAMVVTDPAGNQTVHVFQVEDGSAGFYQTEALSYQGPAATGQLLTRRSTRYGHSGSYSDGHAVAWKISDSNELSTVYYSYAPGAPIQGYGPSPDSTNYIPTPTFVGKPSSVITFDKIKSTYVATDLSYQWQCATDSATCPYFTAGLLNSTSSETVSSLPSLTGAKTQLAQILIGYDDPSRVVASSVSTQHVVAIGQRGLATSISRWRNTDNAYISKYVSWFDTGMPNQTFDTNGVLVSDIEYSNTYAGAFPTSSTDAASNQSQKTYDFNTGAPISSATPAMVATGSHISYQYYNTGQYRFGHLASVSTPSLPDSTFDYLSPTVTTSSIPGDGVTIQTKTIRDGLGRTLDSQILNAPSTTCAGGIIHQTNQYDFAGRKVTISKPFCSSSDATANNFSYIYDALGRVTNRGWDSDRRNGGQIFSYPYPALQTETSNEGATIYRQFDGSGHPLYILEDSVTGDSGVVETDYNFDALGRLVSVDQFGDPDLGSATTDVSRWFTYNSLSQVTSEHEPETGDQAYTYDNRGNLSTSVDARSVQSLYCYDSSNRVLSISSVDTSCSPFGASANPFVRMYYDMAQLPSGQANLASHLSAVQRLDGGIVTSAEYYSYSILGQQTSTSESLPSDASGVMHSSFATYTPSGDLKTLTYPSGRMVEYDWDSVDNLKAVTDVTGGTLGTQYLHDTSYYADGSWIQKSIGSMTIEVSRNPVSRPNLLTVTNPTIGTLMNKMFAYDEDRYGSPLISEVDLLHTSSQYGTQFSSVYDYDIFGRLSSFSHTGVNGSMDQVYTYDSFNNLIGQSGSGITALTSNVDARNRLVATTFGCSAASGVIGGVDPTNSLYDKSGHLLCDGLSPYTDHQYLYDQTGMLKQVLQHNALAATYTYSGEGNRVRVDKPNGQYREYEWFGGQVLSERSSDGTTTGYTDSVDYIYANGKKIASIASQAPSWHLSGTGTGSWSCGSQFWVTGTATAFSAANPLPIKSGDHLVADMKVIGAHTDFLLLIDGAEWTDTVDQEGGSTMYYTPPDTNWHHRVISLDAWAGHGATAFNVGIQQNGATGQNDVWIRNASIVRADGTIVPLFRSNPVSMTNWDGTVLGSNPVNTCTENGLTLDFNNVTLGEDEGTTYYLSDQLGTARMAASSSGVPLWIGDFTPFGRELGDTASSPRYKFTGRERDAESGLDDFSARFYQSSTGRFSSPDPSGLMYASLANPKSFNLYTYAGNHPTMSNDPTGLHEEGGDTGDWRDVDLKTRVEQLIGWIESWHIGGHSGGGSSAGGQNNVQPEEEDTSRIEDSVDDSLYHTSIEIDYTKGLVVQGGAGFSLPYDIPVGFGGSLTYVPSTGNVWAGYGSGASTTGLSAYAGIGATSNPDQSGSSFTYTANAPVGISHSISGSGDITTLAVFGTPGVSYMKGITLDKPLFSVPAIPKGHMTVPVINDSGAVNLGDGLVQGSDPLDLRP